MSIFDWSTTAGNNTTVGSINWAEGQAPSTVNDSARAEMADVAAWRDFLGGAKTTSGTDTITLTSGMSVTAYAVGQMFVAKLGGTNTGAATLNIDSVGAAAVEINGSAVSAGDLASGKYYLFVYDGTAFQATRLSGGVKVSSDDTTPSDLETKVLASGLVGLTTQNGGGNETRTVDVPIASQAQAEAGTDNATAMTPLRAAQAIAALAASGSDQVARDMAASALAYVLAQNDATSIAGSLGAFWLSDDFESDSLAVKTNATYDATNDKYHNPAGADTGSASTTYTSILDADHGSQNWDDYSIRQVVPNASISTSGDWVRVQIVAPATGTFSADNISIVERSGSTADGTVAPTELLFSGGSGVTVSGGSSTWSDWTQLAIDETKDYLAIIDFNATNDDGRYKESTGTSYYKAATNSYATQSVSGFSSETRTWCVGNIEVAPSASPADMTLEPSDATLTTANPTDLLAYFVIDPGTADFDTNGDAGAGDDIIGKMSIDSGATLATGTWTKVGDIGSSGEELWRLEADVSGQTGSALMYQITTQNTETVELHDCVGVVAIY